MSDQICPHTKKKYDCGRCKGAESESRTGKYHVHMSQSISGPIRNWTKSDWKRATKYMTKDDDSKFTADELKDEFMKMHQQGIEVMPIGNCDNFCYKNGCMKHPAKSAD